MSHADKMNDDIKARIEALVGDGPEGTIAYYTDSPEEAISEIGRGWAKWRADLIARLAKEARILKIEDSHDYLALDLQPIRKGVKLRELVQALVMSRLPSLKQLADRLEREGIADERHQIEV